MRLKILLQQCSRKALGQRCFLQAGNIKIHQRQVDLFKAFFNAQQPAVNFELCPVQLPAVLGHSVQVTAKGFDLLKLVALRVIAIGPAAHLQGFVFTFQADFGLVLTTPARRHQCMARHTFLG
ncbi:hypothetical protein LP417_07395 [Polaromonas sp. P1-6]|nr:hypothetical protein LP417_07395 [Polaromonas sp. P1-6]